MKSLEETESTFPRETEFIHSYNEIYYGGSAHILH